MKIAIFHNLPSGGAKRFTCQEVRELAKRGHELAEFAPSTADLTFCPLAPYVREQRIFPCPPVSYTDRRIPFITPYIHAISSINALRRIERLNAVVAREIDEGSFDLVFVTDCQVVLKPYILRYLRTPTVFQCHHTRDSLDDQRRSRRPTTALQKLKALYFAPARASYCAKFDKDEARNIRSASSVLANSTFSKARLAQQYGVQSHVVYPGVDTDIFRPGCAPRESYVLAVGSLTYQKGYRFLVSALARIDSARRPRLFIAANSTDPEEERLVRQLAAQQGVGLHIESIGDDERLTEVYQRAKAFVYAPFREPLGLAPLEAMACGTPVLAVAEGGVTETVIDGTTGWLVERDSEVFADRLSSLLSDDSTRARLGRAGREYISSQWTWPKAVDRLEAELQAVAR